MPTCFIIRPLRDDPSYDPGHFEKVERALFEPAIRAAGFEPKSPWVFGSVMILGDIIRNIRNSELVLCDLSALNANVHIELGMRFATGKPVAIVGDEKTDIPSDIIGRGFHRYPSVLNVGNIPDEIAKLTRHLQGTVDEVEPLPTLWPGQNELLKDAAACGIKTIFLSRDEAKGEIIEAIGNAKHRVWLLGVGFSKIIRLTSERVLPVIRRKLQENEGKRPGETFNARILMLDALSTTGVFRTFLESSAEQIEEILDTKRHANHPPTHEPYTSGRLYGDFEYACKELRRYPEFADVVRFYSHTPICWLVIADDVAYFQPYTFGRGAGSDDHTIGHFMPVFKFDGAAAARPFDILVDHFDKLWMTTSTDLFHVWARMTDENYLLYDIFRKRRPWLEHVYGELHLPRADKSKVRRRSPRRPCKSGLKNEIRLLEPPGEEIIPVRKIVNFSRRGLALLLPQVGIRVGNRIKLTVLPPPESVESSGPKQQVNEDEKIKDLKAGDYVRIMLVEPCDGVFEVVDVKETEVRNTDGTVEKCDLVRVKPY